MTNPPTDPHHNAHDDPESAPHQPEAGSPGIIVDEQGHPYAQTKKSYKPFKYLNSKRKGLWAKVPHGDRMMIVLTAVIAFSTIGQLVISYCNNVSTGKQVERIIQSTDRIDDAADSFSRSSAFINDGVTAAVSELSRQNITAEHARQASDESSRKALKATMDKFDMAQRPWVGLVTPIDDDHQTLFDTIIPGQPSGYHYRYRNYGNSPALRVRQHGTAWVEYAEFMKVDWVSVRRKIEFLPLADIFDLTIYNGDENSLEPGHIGEVLDPMIVGKINSGDYIAVLAGRIEYNDALSAHTHHTTWCVIYVPPAPGKFPGFRDCPITTEAD